MIMTLFIFATTIWEQEIAKNAWLELCDEHQNTDMTEYLNILGNFGLSKGHLVMTDM